MAPAVTCSTSPVGGLFPRAPPDWLPPAGAMPGGANAVLCCAGAGFRTTGPEDPRQSASNSSPELRQFPDDKPQVSVRFLLSALPGFRFRVHPCLGDPSLPLCGRGVTRARKGCPEWVPLLQCGDGVSWVALESRWVFAAAPGWGSVCLQREQKAQRLGRGGQAQVRPTRPPWRSVGASLVHVVTWARACAEEASPLPAPPSPPSLPPRPSGGL